MTLATKRHLALALPDLACELASLSRESRVGVAGALGLDTPLAVVVADDKAQVTPSARLSAVSLRARKAGVYVGQRVSSARSLAAGLDVVRLAPGELDEALRRVADIGLGLAPTVAIVDHDTIVLDVTGVAHLHGGEEALLHEAIERVRVLGHRVRGAVATGPRIARALAHHATSPRLVVAPGAERVAMAKLPTSALPMSEDARAFFARAGIFSVEALAERERASITARLGDEAPAVLALLDGDDRTALDAYVPDARLVESVSWDDAVSGNEPLLFASRGLLARLASRLEGRRKAVSTLVTTLRLDRSVAALHDAPPESTLTLELPLPLHRSADLVRALRVKLEQAVLAAPVRELVIEALGIVDAKSVQLDLSRDTHTAPESVAVLLSELTSELGADKVGVLAAHRSHLAEDRAPLVPIAPESLLPDAPRRRARPVGDEEQLSLFDADPESPPARLLPTPCPIEGRLARGSLVMIDRVPLEIVDIEPIERIERVVWWRGKTKEVSRDAARVTFASREGVLSGIVIRTRNGRSYVHGWAA